MNMNQHLQTEAARIATRHHLSLIVLFGSQATGRAHAKSDVDIAVLGERPFTVHEIAAISGAFYDACKRDDVEVVDLALSSPTLSRAVVEDGRVLYERNLGGFFVWKLGALTEWRETAWLRALRNKKLHEWAQAIPAT